MAMADIRVPTLGESITEATVGKWFKKPGDTVAVDEPLVELETDKVTLEVPAPATGAVGGLLGAIRAGAAVAAKPAAATKPAIDAPEERTAKTKPVVAGPERPLRHEMPSPPSVRKLAAESGVDPSNVAGTGLHGQVTKGDMLAAIERAAAQPTLVPTPAPGPLPGPPPARG